MQINPKLIKKQFEKSLSTYDENAQIQKIMAKNLVENICKFNTNFDNILELGSGTGLLTKEIAQNLNFKKYFANDLTEKSEKYLKEIISDVIFYCGNAKKIKPPQKFDLIVSNAMFQWFKNLEEISDNCKNQLNPNGILAFSTFSPENFKEIRKLTGLSLDYKSLNELENIFKKNFEILYTEEFEQTLKFQTPLELLAHMKNTGVNSLTTQHWTFKEVKEFCEKYSQKFPQITLTYAPIIFICKKLA